MDIERNDEQNREATSSQEACSDPETTKDKTSRAPHLTEVENAHASGMGSMGRSDEKVKDKDRQGGNNNVVY